MEKNDQRYYLHILSHTHWDREWYLNSKYTNEWLVPFFDKLFDMMEKRPNYLFILDGQMSMVEDYFEELDKQGKGVTPYKEKIKKYVQEGRLFIGPYYLQPDWQLLSEESLVRNLLIGNKLSQEFGKRMDVGWMLDNFGQISQTAQIHKEANLRGLFVWRGVEMDPNNVQSEFIWEAPDGTQIHAVYLLDSYRNAMRLAEYKEIMEKRIHDTYNKLKPFATTRNMLLMNGYDQEMVPDDVLPFIENGQMDTDEYKVVQSTPERYIDELIKHNPQLQTLHGALYSGRFISVFPGVLSSRMYLKLQNDQSQKALEKYAEPLSALAWLLGGEYDANTLEQAWKYLLKNHPHDSICGVSIDNVHTDMEERFRIVQQLAQSQMKGKLQYLASIIDTTEANGEEATIVFNPNVHERSEVIDIGEPVYVENIPALGYKVVKKELSIHGGIRMDGNFIENDFIIVEILEDGTYNLTDKQTKKKYTGLGVIEDLGDAGDEYNYSYPDIDKIYSTKGQPAKITFVEKGTNRVKVRIETYLEVPEGLTEDRKKRRDVLRPMPIVTYLTIDHHSPVVKCKTEIKNTVKDHLVRVLFPTDLQAEYSYAGSPFDVVKRPIHIEDYDESSIPDHVKKVIIGAREAKPNTIFPQREFVDVHDGMKGLAIFSKGMPEYTILRERNTIALTLFRSVAWIATEINTRIGDAGPKILTPDAQCLRQMSFEYAVYPHKGDTESGYVSRESDLYNSDLLVFKTSVHKGELPSQQSFIEMKDGLKQLKITAVKRSEDGDALIIRGFNPSDKTVRAELTSLFTIRDAKFVNLLEEVKSEIKIVNQHRLPIEIGPKKIFTIRLEVERKSLKVKSLQPIDIVDRRTIEDFSQFESVPLVTEEEIKSEEVRAEQLRAELDNPMLRRTALEAQLSAILTKSKYSETKIRKLGYLLNDARVLRRVYDYILEYQEKKVKN
jgi:mannosylglycerate hydrolase